MKIVRHIKHHVNMANYEWVEASASAEIEFSDDDNVVPALDRLQKLLDDSIQADLTEIRGNTDPDADFDSYITNWRLNRRK